MVTSRKLLDAFRIMPIWTPDMGARLKTARQKMDIDQEHLSFLLGISQSALSKLESGRSKGSRSAINLQQWSDVLKEHLDFVMAGTRAHAYDADQIRIKYNFKRFNGRCKDSDNKSYVYQRKKRLTLK